MARHWSCCGTAEHGRRWPPARWRGCARGGHPADGSAAGSGACHRRTGAGHACGRCMMLVARAARLTTAAHPAAAGLSRSRAARCVWPEISGDDCRSRRLVGAGGTSTRGRVAHDRSCSIRICATDTPVIDLHPRCSMVAGCTVRCRVSGLELRVASRLPRRRGDGAAHHRTLVVQHLRVRQLRVGHTHVWPADCSGWPSNPSHRRRPQCAQYHAARGPAESCHRIWLRNSRVRSCCGLANNASGVPSSTICP